MSFDAEKLYNLLPVVHRTRDAEQGYPLRQLIEVIADQVAVLDENLDRLYDNQFVETATPWALPYIADLLGLRGLSSDQARTLSPRAEIGHTIAYRRRKGTAAMLEQLALDVTGWPAHAVEFFERLAATQNWNHTRSNCHSFASLRNADKLEFVNTPFEEAMRTVEVRRIASGRGKWNIPNIGLFLWRLKAFSLTGSPLKPAKIGGTDSKRHFRFHPLGLDAPLFNLPRTEEEITHLAEPANVPMPITKRMLRGKQVDAKSFPSHPLCFHPSENYYGEGKSFYVKSATDSAVLPEKIIICDLANKEASSSITGWTHDDAAGNFVLLDPQRGRVVFPNDQDSPPLASFHYGFSANLGGGEYERSLVQTHGPEACVPKESANSQSYAKLDDALDAVRSALSSSPEPGLVEIMDSGRYELQKKLIVLAGRMELRAADGRFPLVNLLEQFEITGAVAGSVSLNGVLLAGEAIKITGDLGHFNVRHCTLASHLVVKDDGKLADDGANPCLTIGASGTQVEFENCLLGPVEVTGHDVTLSFRNCIIDARAQGKDALSDDFEKTGPSRWILENCTVIGEVDIGVLELASNTIFLGDKVNVQRIQEGCVRFCWLPSKSRVPRRHQCADSGVRPVFTSLQFGDPAYGQLSRFCPEAVRTGADDGSEMGAFHDLFQPQREAYLRRRLEEYLRLGLEAGIFYAS